jgi:V/A-type H+-transporting ATPase subunit I
MAIAKMEKVLIISHRSQASELLEALQREGICQILNAQEATVSKSFPELAGLVQKPKDIERMLTRLEKSISFLKNYDDAPKGLAAALAPRTVIDEHSYNEVISNREIFDVIERCEKVEESMEKTKGEIQNLQNILETLGPWETLDTPVEDISHLSRTKCWTGLIPVQYLSQAREKINELDAVMQEVGSWGNKQACIIVALLENTDEIQKALRSVEFDAVSFEGMWGTVSRLIEEHNERLVQAQKLLEQQTASAAELSRHLLQLRILYDHYSNLLSRETAKSTAPTTEQTVIFEGWVRKHDYKKLEKIVLKFDAAGLTRTLPAEDEEIPVEIENKNIIKPFEVVTRLYGMPKYFNVDPTAFLMPFFAFFFGMCIADAGYGLLMIALLALIVKKMQGDKKLLYMLGLCAVATIIVGSLTGGWFGDAIKQFAPEKYRPVLLAAREKVMWFDPFKDPMIFFMLAVGLGYFQLITGLFIAFGHNLRRREFTAAICDQLMWIVMLNSIVLFGASKAGAIPAEAGNIFGYVAIVPAVMIFLFSHREGGVGARLGMGFYNLFSTVFYLGDVLSYLRLMALGMVGAGLAMAINVIAKVSIEIPAIGIVIAILILIGGHIFNMLLAVLSAFVHTLRLQYVEFFPKFLAGGGREFHPLSKDYKHIYIEKNK